MAWKIISATVTVATAGTPVQVSSTVLYSPSVVIQANTDNAGTVYVGDSLVDALSTPKIGIALLARSTITLNEDSKGSDYIDLSKIYIDSGTNGQVVQVMYMVKV